MSRRSIAPARAAGLVGGSVGNGGWAGRIRAVIVLGLRGGVAVSLGHDRDGPPGEDHASRIWPAVL